jgi:uncharacterized protein YbjT (DUF2867 family)
MGLNHSITSSARASSVGDVGSPSPYIRSRGEGEAAVQTAFPGAVIIRAAVMFAPDDAFLTTILDQWHMTVSSSRLSGTSALDQRGRNERAH